MTNELPASYTMKTVQTVITEDMLPVKEVVENTESRFDMTKALKDGEYTAEVDGQEGPMTVKTTIAGGKISAVEIVSNNETQSIAAPAMDSVPAAIVAGNTCDVDTVAGATLTSNRIMDAVALCLTEAAK